ncbi:hypothetical protein [uncultured Tenacibaculum sp.]|uniref:hypothetical protein n=1 Tax=uncultured Tenacibaculum sp. TaxID=174713 RepID=UPI0026353985|nr:hypothetical protein [uncultured Tenacibaculum sp.]
MKKSILNIGKALNKAEQKNINGGFGELFIGSSCYTTQSRCNSAMAAAISNGANPSCTRCEPCTTFFGTSGFQVRIYC